MPTLTDLHDHLRDQAPPPPTGDDLRQRRTRRHRRQRATAAASVAMVVLVAGFALARTGDDGPPREVATAADPTELTGPVAAPAPEPVAGTGMAIAPGTDLADEAWVEITLDPAPPAGTDLWVQQCTDDVLPLLGSGEVPASECGSTVWQREAGGPLRVWLLRTLTGTGGVPIDCAEAPGRCVLGVRVGATDSTDDRWVPLDFASGDPGHATSSVPLGNLPGGTHADGEAVTVTLDHLEPGATATVVQCDDRGAATTDDDCDSTSAVTSSVAGADGTAEATITVRRRIDTAASGSVDCYLCILWIRPDDGSPWLQPIVYVHD